MAQLKAQQIMHRYGQKALALDHVSVEIQSGEIYGILGPNGAGKTTLFKILVGLIQPSKGEVYLDGKRITDALLSERAQNGLIYLPQESSIFHDLTVEENLLAVAECANPPSTDRIKEMLQSFQLNAVASQKARTLSGGQRRRVEIARSILLNPKFILLDEPFAGIDPIAMHDIKAILHDLSEQDIGIIITDHNVRETLEICHVGSLLYQGHILCQGTPEHLTTHPEAKRIYFGSHYHH